MHIRKLINLLVFLSVVLVPKWFHADVTMIADTELSAMAGESCAARQPDLSVGVVLFTKGQTGLNGTKLQSGAHIRNGDVLSTAVDGYIAVELGDSKVVTVQPGTLLRVDCASPQSALNAMGSFTINGAHMHGGMRG